MCEMGPNTIEELSNLRKKSTEYILQQNFKAALPLVEEIVKNLPGERCNEMNLTEEDLYVINCAHCLCVLHEKFDEAEKILNNVETNFKFKMPLLYFMFCKEYFKRGLLADVKEYAQKFLNAYYENLFKEKCKVYYWIANIPVKYEQFSTIKELTNEVLEQLSCKENNDENSTLLREIFVALEEVLFYTQTEDSIKKSFYEISPITKDSDDARFFRAKSDKELINSKVTINTQTEGAKMCDFSAQINLDKKPPIVETWTQTNTNWCCVATQTVFPKKQTAVQVNIPNKMDGEDNLKDKVKQLEQLIEDQKNTIKNQDEKCKKLHEQNLIESVKWEVRFEILEEQLQKTKDAYENGIKEIASLQANLKNECIRNCNLQLNVYTQYAKKCQKMMRDLNNVMPHLTPYSIPTSSECSSEINLWKDELCKADYCKSLLKVHEESLKLKFDPRSFLLDLPDIPDCPIEARDILHDSFQPVMLRIIKNESAKLQVGSNTPPILSYVQGVNLRYPVMPLGNTNVMQGYISSPFHQPTLFPQPIQPPVQTKSKPSTPNLVPVVNNTNDGVVPTKMQAIQATTNTVINNHSKSSSCNSSSSETSNTDWFIGGQDTKITEFELTAIPSNPVPLSSLMKLARKNKDTDNTEKSDEEVFKKKEFKDTYAYIKENLSEVPDEELLNILKIVREQNPDDFELVNREEILNRSIRIIFEDDKCHNWVCN